MCRGNGIQAARVPRVAAQQAPAGEPAPSERSVRRDGLDGVGRARGIEAAARTEQRGDQELISAEQQDHHPGHGRPFAGAAEGVNAASARSSASASSAEDAVAAAGRARTTSRVPGGRASKRAATRCRSRRRTWLRMTAPPTARETTNPACAWGAPLSLGAARCTTTNGVATPPARRRPARSVATKSVLRRNRAPAGSTPVRPRAASDPWPGVRREWRDRHACASAGGTRGSSPADGCSAGRCACSLVGSRTTVWNGGDGAVAGLFCRGFGAAGASRPRSDIHEAQDCMDTRRRPS